MTLSPYFGFSPLSAHGIPHSGDDYRPNPRMEAERQARWYAEQQNFWYAEQQNFEANMAHYALQATKRRRADRLAAFQARADRARKLKPRKRYEDL